MGRDPNKHAAYGGIGPRLYTGLRILFQDDYTPAGGNGYGPSEYEDRFEPSYVEMFWRYRTEQEEREWLEACKGNYERSPGNQRVLSFPYFWPEKEEQ